MTQLAFVEGSCSIILELVVLVLFLIWVVPPVNLSCSLMSSEKYATQLLAALDIIRKYPLHVFL